MPVVSQVLVNNNADRLFSGDTDQGYSSSSSSSSSDEESSVYLPTDEEESEFRKPPGQPVEDPASRKRTKQEPIIARITKKNKKLKDDLHSMEMANRMMNNDLIQLKQKLREVTMRRANDNADNHVLMKKTSLMNDALEKQMKVLSKTIKQLEDTNNRLMHDKSELEEEVKGRNLSMMATNLEFAREHGKVEGLKDDINQLTKQLKEKTPGHCSICKLTTATCVSLACGHFICCEGCLHMHVWQDKLKDCPECRKKGPDGVPLNRNTVSVPVKGIGLLSSVEL